MTHSYCHSTINLNSLIMLNKSQLWWGLTSTYNHRVEDVVNHFARACPERETVLLILFSSNSSRLCAVAVPVRACCINEICSSNIAVFTVARHQNISNNRNDTGVESFAIQTVFLTICYMHLLLPFLYRNITCIKFRL